MAKKAPTKEVTWSCPTPTTLMEAADDERQIGKLLGDISKEEQTLADAVRVLGEETEKTLAPLRAEVLGRAKALYEYVAENRSMLTQGGTSKTIVFALAGEVSWRDTPGKVKFRAKVETILEHIRSLKLVEFIRQKEEPDKEAMLKKPELARTIPGISITKGEKFAIRPSGCDSRVERDPSDQWRIVTKSSENLEEE